MDKRPEENYYNIHSTVRTVSPDTPGALVNQSKKGTNQENQRAKAVKRKSPKEIQMVNKYMKECSPSLIIRETHTTKNLPI